MVFAEDCVHHPNEVHVRTTLIIVAVFGALLFACRKSWMNWRRVFQPAERYRLNLIDHLVGVALLIVLVITVYQRVERGVAHWCLQPCHPLTLLLILTVYHTGEIRFFPAYMYLYWQGWFAFTGVDYSWYQNDMELYMFFVQHYLMILVPFYYLFFTTRFHWIYRSTTVGTRFKSALFFYSMGMLYHILVLLPLGLYTETDYDNMVCPAAPAVAMGLGSWWREAQAGIFAIWALFIGFGVESVGLVFRKLAFGLEYKTAPSASQVKQMKKRLKKAHNN
mmetsp:Transcript_9771/g.24412  ORF Transcript_9771/g.24412 Transcript_9771/m.24412 type:complete len:278 (-) Transcript_9771:33-866(-)